MNQSDINKLASEPTYKNNGEKKGCGFWIMWLFVLAVIIGGLLIALSTGNLDLHV